RRRARVDRRDPGVPERAPHHGHPHLAGEGEVVDVPALTGEQLRVLLAQDRRPDEALDGGGHHAPPPDPAPAGVFISAAAARIEATMFWYPVQRQRFPSRPCRTSASVSSASLSRIKLSAARIIPGVQ